MDNEVLIILALLVGSAFLIWLLLSIINGAPIKVKLSVRPAENPELEHKADVLEQIFRLPGTRNKYRKGAAARKLSVAEENLVMCKVFPLYTHLRRSFHVTAYSDEKELKKWLDHPVIKSIYPAPIDLMLKASANSTISVDRAEKILKKLLGENYSFYYKMGEYKVNDIEKMVARNLAIREQVKRN